MQIGGRRRDIQLLRAVAVLMVIGAHYAPARFPGGYVGVDVFFVVSGFVLLGPLLWSGEPVRLRSFYARRVRRILPAALVCIVATTVAFGTWLTPNRVEDLTGDALAAALFVLNFGLVDQPGGYFSPAQPPPLLHLWSLAVEEQFYLLAPLLALLLLRSTRKVAVLGAVTIASFVAAVVLARSSPDAAFYLLPSRIWEFGVGALVAGLTAPGVRTGRVLVAGGLAGLVAATFVLDPASGVPGPAALLPVLATAALLAGGTSLAVPAWLSPGVRIGDASYSLYLWHWPPLCFLLLDAGIDPPSLRARAGALVVGLALGVASYLLVERPLHLARPAVRRPRVAIAVGIATAVGVAGFAAVLPGAVPATTDRSADPLTAQAVLAGPLPDTGYVPRNVRPSLRDPDSAGTFPQGCVNEPGDAALHPCVRGDQQAERTVALVGDSLSLNWVAALDLLAGQQGFRLVVLTKGYCPLVAVPGSGNGDPSCPAWRAEALAYLRALAPEQVLLGSASAHYLRHVATTSALPAALDAAWSGLRQALPAPALTMLGDVPKPPSDPLACLARHRDATEQCAFGPPASHAPALHAEADAARKHGARVVDPTAWLCHERCPLVSGNVVVYRDRLGHLTWPGAQLLAPRMAAALRTPSPAPGA